MTIFSKKLLGFFAIFLFYTHFLLGVPLITNLNPTAGPTTGGNFVTITGNGFLGATAVNFGPYSSSFAVVSDQLIIAIAPPGAATNAIVTITSPSGTSPTHSEAIYTYQGNWTAYTTDFQSDSVTIFKVPTDIPTNIGGEISAPTRIAISADGLRAYFTNQNTNNLGVLDLTTNTIINQIPVGTNPFDVALNPVSSRAYVTNLSSNDVSVIDLITNTVIATIPVGNTPQAIIILPNGTKAYVANINATTISVLDLATNTVSSTINITGPVTRATDFAVNTTGTRVYVTLGNGTIRTINTATDTFIGTPLSTGGVVSRGIAVNTAETLAFVANFASGTLSRVDLVANTSTSVAVGAGANQVVINAANTRAYVTASNANTLSLVDITSTPPTLIQTIALGITPAGISLTPDEQTAYVTNVNSDTISIVDTSNSDAISVIGTIRGTFSNPLGIAINPNGTLALVSNSITDPDKGISIIDIATNTVIGEVTGLTFPNLIAITPDGTKAYVTNSVTAGTVSVLDLTTPTFPVIATISVGNTPFGIAITPDGTKAYVANVLSGTVSIIDTASNTVTATIPGITNANVITITPDGSKAYISDAISNVYVLNLSNNSLIGSIPVDLGPEGIAINPSGTLALVANQQSTTISIIDIATDTVINTINVGANPSQIWITPDGARAYVVLRGANQVVALDLTSAGFPIIDTIATATGPYDIVITPDQAPVASFTFIASPPGQTTTFDASNSRTSVGTIVSYTWNFGDGTIVTTASPTIGHIYGATGFYVVTLTVVNSNGTSTTQIFTGQTLTRNGGASAITSATVAIGITGPTVTSVIPNSGPSSGGTTVNITGTNFLNVLNVFFGSTPAESFIVVSDTLIIAVAPPGIGTVDVTVVTSAGTSPITPADQFTYVSIFPPRHVRGKQVKNEFAYQTDIVNVITWRPPSLGEIPIAYRIYRNASLTKLAGTVEASENLVFKDHNRKPYREYVYYIVSVSESGVQSEPVRIEIPGRHR